MAQINGVQVPFIPIERKTVPQKQTKGTVEQSSFKSVFQKELERIKFSKHATERLSSREIALNEMQLAKLQEAVDKAEQKGSRDSLVMMDNTAFIVNIPNRTVVTAVPVSPEEENIFTNIDSVVFAH